MKRVAAATIRSLLENLARTIADPAPEPLPEPGPAPAWPLARPEEAYTHRLADDQEAASISARGCVEDRQDPDPSS